jgi:hypothetical protein
MPHNQTPQIDTIIDTIVVYNHCLEGFNCPNHPHGIRDSSVFFQSYIGRGKSYTKVSVSEMDNSVNCDNLFKDTFGNIFYLEPEVKQIKNVMEQPKLTSFDSIKVGDKIFPAATPFIPKYFTHKDTPMPIHNRSEMLYDVSCFTILVLFTVYVAANNAWGKLWNEIVNA